MGNAIIEAFEREGVVVPLSLEKGHFCTAAVDNIDVDPKSSHSNVTKNTAWKIWQVFPEVNETFATLSDEPTEDCLRNALPLIERFVILF